VLDDYITNHCLYQASIMLPAALQGSWHNTMCFFLPAVFAAKPRLHTVKLFTHNIITNNLLQPHWGQDVHLWALAAANTNMCCIMPFITGISQLSLCKRASRRGLG
jgi:hypothetical protein